MGFVMEYLHSATGATKREQFIEPLTALRPATSWTEGEWELGTERRRWNSLQNLSADWKLLSFRSEEHTSELQSLMRISYAVFCLKKKKENKTTNEKRQ